MILKRTSKWGHREGREANKVCATELVTLSTTGVQSPWRPCEKSFRKHLRIFPLKYWMVGTFIHLPPIFHLLRVSLKHFNPITLPGCTFVWLEQSSNNLEIVLRCTSREALRSLWDGMNCPLQPCSGDVKWDNASVDYTTVHQYLLIFPFWAEKGKTAFLHFYSIGCSHVKIKYEQ